MLNIDVEDIEIVKNKNNLLGKINKTSYVHFLNIIFYSIFIKCKIWVILLFESPSKSDKKDW